MKHECTQMMRSREVQTVLGQQAYGMYKVWLEKQRRKAPVCEAFCTSAYYSSFLKFAQWSRETGIPDPQKYIEIMVDKKIAPALWRRNEAYGDYIEYIDKRSDPYEQVNTTVETILTLAEGLEIPPAQVFDQFSSGEITELIQQRRLSPWILLCSNAFKGWVGKLHPGERQELMKIIGNTFWATRFEKHPDVVKNSKEITDWIMLRSKSWFLPVQNNLYIK